METASTQIIVGLGSSAYVRKLFEIKASTSGLVAIKILILETFRPLSDKHGMVHAPKNYVLCAFFWPTFLYKGNTTLP